MNVKRLVCALLLLTLLPTAALADVLAPGQKPPRNEHSEVFVTLYADGLTGWDSAYAGAFEGGGELILWSYPNSGKITGRTNSDWFRDNESLEKTFDICYRDGEGRFWGYVNYIYGQKMNWVCISDPTNDAIPADAAVTAAVDEAVSAMLWRERGPAIVLVAAVVAVTLVLLYVFWFRGKKRQAN